MKPTWLRHPGCLSRCGSQLIALLVFGPACTSGDGPGRQGAEPIVQPSPIAIVGATVVPMNERGLLPNHTVVVIGERIAAVGPTASIRLPPGAQIIEASGRYLLPGLADMHVHLTAEIGARADFGDGPLFLAAGVTTVLNLRGDSTTLAWRQQVNARQLVGPTIYTTGDFVNEPRVNSPDEGEREIRAQAGAGFDVIKIREVVDPTSMTVLTTTGMSLDTYRRIMETARSLEIPVIGHVPANLGYQASIDAGQSWAHLYAIRPVVQKGDSALQRVGDDMVLSGIWVTPTLVVYRADALAGLPEASLVAESAREWWGPFTESAPPDRADRAREMLHLLQHAVRVLHERGVPFLVGTDALGWPFMVPGSGIHEELRLLQEAGLSSYDVLRAATVEPARFLKRTEEFGTIEAGKRADLILTAGDPLDDLGTLRHPVAVMARGVWRDSLTLGRLIEGLMDH